jgi:hypothetical protein
MAEPESLTKEKLVRELAEIDKHLTIEELIDILGSTIKHDDQNKAITFLGNLLTYTEEDQINIGFLAESSTGKSYIPLELSWYFPKDDVRKLGYASRQSFFHEEGEWVVDPTDKRDIPDDKKRKIKRIDCHQKIIIFMDQPHDLLLQTLRPLLSHDDKEIPFQITDKSDKYGLRTKKGVLIGFPTVLFCSAKFTMQDQEKTRLLLLSPEITQEKIREAIALKIEKESDREAYGKSMEANQDRKNLATRVWAIKREQLKGVRIPEDIREKIFEKFMEDHPFLSGRNMRDISRLLGIIKGYAILNFKQHQKINDYLIATEEDIQEGFRLYYAVSVPNELGLSPELWDIFQKAKTFIESKVELKTKAIDDEEIEYKINIGICRKDLQQWYYKTYHKVLGRDRATDMLKIWETVGLIVEQPNPEGDKRITNYVLADLGVTEDDTPHSNNT